MACYHPVSAWRTDSGSILWAPREGRLREIQLPCGQCIGCRLERSRQWAARCMHEAALHDRNCFITLTYDDAHLPPGGSLVYGDYQAFMRRLRKAAGRLRFYMCGEYGETTFRPHYHAALFGYDFPDKVTFSRNGGNILYTSKLLSRLWPAGHASVGALTFDSAAYIARYVTKKIVGDKAEAHYRRVDKTTGEITQLVPEFNHMSLKPGIGKDWIRLYHPEILANGGLVINGHLCKSIPRYYSNYLKELDSYVPIAQSMYAASLDRVSDNTSSRLKVREQVAYSKSIAFKREVDL